MVAALFVLPLVAHLALAFPAGRVTDRWARLFLAIGYGVTATVSLGRALFRDPFLDQYCWTNCTDNVFLLRADQDVSRLLEGLGLRAAVVVGAATAGACVWRLARATPVARKSTWFVLIPASGAALAIMAYALLLLRNPAENPEQGDFAAAFMVRAATLAALAAGVGWGVLRTIRTRQRA